MFRHQRRDDPSPSLHAALTDSVAAVYNEAGDDYVAYADGDPQRLFSFEGLHAYSDQRVWSLLESKLRDIRNGGGSSVRILDAGCGPGTWLRRCVVRARQLGFAEIAARGFDIADAQIRTARRLARDLIELPGVRLTFDVADLTERFSEADDSVDLTLCLYSVLSHLPVASLPQVTQEMGRVTRGHCLATVRSIGSRPTIFVDSIEKAQRFQLDHGRDRCEVELCNGRRIALNFHLFKAGELRDCFAIQFEIEELSGLDIFHDRFMPDARWNPASMRVDRELMRHLAELEEAYARTPAFMERATHLLFMGRRRSRRDDGVSTVRQFDLRKAQ